MKFPILGLCRILGVSRSGYYKWLINQQRGPVDNDLFTEVVICENDKTAEPELVNYLQDRFPNKTISTINFFDLRSEKEVNEIFKKATYITFSTTFSNFDWFKKLSNNLSENHKVIGFCHCP